MFIIIVGCGQMGAMLAKVMEDNGNEIVIIDNNRERFLNLHTKFGGLLIEGNPTDQRTLIKAGIESSDILVSLTADDNINIIVCQMAKEIFGVKRVLARIADPAKEDIFNHFGLQTICQTNLVVDIVQRIIEDQITVTELVFGNSTISISQIEAEIKYIGKRLGRYPKKNLHIMGIIKNHIFYFYEPGIVIHEGDKLVVSKKVD